MKRTDLESKKVPESKVPTIDQLLYSMPKTGLESFEDRLIAYSSLGFYFDGVDYSNQNTRSITKLIKRMDAAASTNQDILELDDEDRDRFGFEFDGIEYWFNSPSIKQLPKTPKENIPKYYRELIEGLSDTPNLVTELPYYLFSSVGDALGKCLGIV